MAGTITNYTELQTAIANWDHRSNYSSVDVQNWIALFEATANRRLRVRQMEASTTITPNSVGVGSLPSDYLQWTAVTWNGAAPRNLEFADRAYMTETYPTSPAASPDIFTIESNLISVMPVDTTSLLFRYYQKIPALTSGNSTNWLLTAHPDVYLWGSLLESNAFRSNPQGATWKARRDEIFDEIVSLDTKPKTPGQIRPQGIPTP